MVDINYCHILSDEKLVIGRRDEMPPRPKINYEKSGRRMLEYGEKYKASTTYLVLSIKLPTTILTYENGEYERSATCRRTDV